MKTTRLNFVFNSPLTFASLVLFLTSASLSQTSAQNPSTAAKGTYQGLFYDTNQIAVQSSGFVSATVTDRGSFSGKIQFMGKSYSGSGQFQPDGSYSNTIPRTGMSPLEVRLQLDLGGSGVLTGQVDDGFGTAQLLAYRIFYSKTNPAPLAGKYTLVFPGSNDPSNEPAGHGFATLTVDALGKIKLGGVLGDGSKVSQKTFVSGAGQFPLFASLYRGNGCFLGWVQFTNDANNAVAADLGWLKLAQAGANFYPNGFTNQIQPIGSMYQFSNGLPVLNITTGQVALVDGNLPGPVTAEFVLGSNNKATGTNKLSIKFTTSSGAFKGAVPNPAGGKNIPINGVVLQNQNVGYGYFLGTNQSGSVALGVAP